MALRLVVLIVPEFVVAKFAVVAVSVVKTAVTAFNIFVARFPVTVRLVAVVEARVEDPLTVRLVKNPVAKASMFPRILVTVVEARVVLPADRLVVERLVEVELVIVPLVVLIDGRVRLVIERLVIVAEVIVALVPFKLVVLVVEALVVEARRVVS